MTDITPMRSADAVIAGVLKIEWYDGFVGIVDLRPIIENGDVFSFLRSDPAAFACVKLESHGHKVFWIDPDGDEIDFGSHALRERAQRQAEILRLAS
ncbi:MAG: hypothetical protein ACRCUE_12400 [Bosea sp. (in: a-proteobacteria)]